MHLNGKRYVPSLGGLVIVTQISVVCSDKEAVREAVHLSQKICKIIVRGRDTSVTNG